MILASPLWLIGLLPWAGATVWLLWGRRKVERVPYLSLWRGPAANHRVRSSFRLPPLALIAMLLAILLGLLAAAGPGVLSTRLRGITLIVDRGLTMSAKGISRARFVEGAGLLETKLHGMAGPVEIVDLLNRERRKTTLDRLQEFVAEKPRTAIDTESLLHPAIVEELSRTGNLVILLSDQRVNIRNSRFVQIAPRTVIQNVGISALAVREAPSPQVMVSIRNDSALTAAQLQIESGGQRVEQRIDLPARGKDAAYFIDLPGFGAIIEARLQVKDDQEADDSAWLVRENRSPRIEVRSAIPESLRRMIDVYAKARPPGEGSPTVAVVNQTAEIRSETAGAVVELPSMQNGATGELRVVADPLTALVDWAEVTRDATVVAVLPEGWTALVQRGDKTLVAKRESAARQIWVGFESPAWPRSVDYVVFWTNAFDWLAGGGQAFAAHPMAMDDAWTREGKLPTDIQGNAWPGIYVRSDGQRKAVNSPLIRPEILDGGGANLDLKLIHTAQTSRDLSAELCLAGMFFVMLAASCWQRLGTVRE